MASLSYREVIATNSCQEEWHEITLNTGKYIKCFIHNLTGVINSCCFHVFQVERTVLCRTLRLRRKPVVIVTAMLV